MSTAPRPGWYPDPAGSHDYRWWDGSGWTAAISESARAPRPEDSVRPGSLEDPDPDMPSVPGRVSLTSGSTDPADPRPTASASASTGAAAAPSRTDDQHPARRPPSRARTLLVLACGFAVFAAAGMGVGLVLWREPSPAATGATSPLNSPLPVAPGAQTAPREPMGQLDESTGVATIGPASMTLPGEPYTLSDDPAQIDGVFDTLFSASAVVHSDYDGKHSWSAAVALAHLSPELTGSADLEHAGSTAVVAVSRHLFGGHRTTISRLASSDRSVDGHPGLMFTVEVHYAVPQLPSRYDRVRALVVRLDDGTLVAAISSVPDDAEPEAERLANESIDTLTIH